MRSWSRCLRTPRKPRSSCSRRTTKDVSPGKAQLPASTIPLRPWRSSISVEAPASSRSEAPDSALLGPLRRCRRAPSQRGRSSAAIPRPQSASRGPAGEIHALLEGFDPPLPDLALAVGGTARAVGRIVGRRFGLDDLEALADTLSPVPAARVTDPLALRRPCGDRPGRDPCALGDRGAPRLPSRGRPRRPARGSGPLAGSCDGRRRLASSTAQRPSSRRILGLTLQCRTPEPERPAPGANQVTLPFFMSSARRVCSP